jgi:transcription factor C subunit 7
VDPTLTGSGVRQSQELAAYIVSPEFIPKPCRVYCSPFYRCLQTIKPVVEALKERQSQEKREDVDLDVRVENGLG